jgi:hypothetical protein
MESGSESIKMYQPRTRSQCEVLNRYSKSTAITGTVTIRRILYMGCKSKKQSDDSRRGDEMSYRFTVINTYSAFMKESESEF